MNEIRKSHRSAANRIHSILEDAEFIRCVQQTYQKPLVPNKRCGLWYVRPELREADCYFKSTDGHTNQWSFSLKRLNLHLIPLVEQHGGIIIVDSTRRGKLMPDALSKTIPIWCAVLNYALLDLDEPDLILPGSCVSASEQDQIRAIVVEWAHIFKTQVPESLRPKLSKPLRPLWITPNSSLPMHDFTPEEQVFADAHSIILCTASKQAQDGEIWGDGYAYVQGAADDHELWAPAAFTSEVLFEHETLLHEPGLSDEEIARRIENVISQPPTSASASTSAASSSPPKRVSVHPHIAVAHATQQAPKLDGPIIDLRDGVERTSPTHWPLSPSKRGSKQLGHALPEISSVYHQNQWPEVTIVSDPGTDFAECVALMLDCKYFEASGLRRDKPANYVAKDEVTRRNLSIIAKSGLAPSRTTQNIIGAFLRK